MRKRVLPHAHFLALLRLTAKGTGASVATAILLAPIGQLPATCEAQQEETTPAVRLGVGIGSLLQKEYRGVPFDAEAWVALVGPRVFPNVRLAFTHMSRPLGTTEIALPSTGRQDIDGLTLGIMPVFTKSGRLYATVEVGAYTRKDWYDRVRDNAQLKSHRLFDPGGAVGLGWFPPWRFIEDQLQGYVEVRFVGLYGREYLVPVTFGIHW